MEGSPYQIPGWSSEEYDASHRAYSLESHAFQPFNPLLQQNPRNSEIPEFFRRSIGSLIPTPPPLISGFSTPSKRNFEEIEEEDDVEIIAPIAPKKKAVSKRATSSRKASKKTVKKEDKEEEEEEDKKHWKDEHVLQMITLRGEMDPEFVKNAKKQGDLLIPKIFLSMFLHIKEKKKFQIQIGPIGPFKGLGLCRPPAPLYPPIQDLGGIFRA